MEFGPMQVLVLGFPEPRFTGEIAAELKRLREHDVIRLVDAVVVSKEAEGEVVSLEASDLGLDEAEELGALAGALIGLGAEGEEGAEVGAALGADAAAEGQGPLGEGVWYIADAIEPGQTAAVLILEHRWALPLRGAVERAGGMPVADAWLHPGDLVDLGAELARVAPQGAAPRDVP